VLGERVEVIDGVASRPPVQSDSVPNSARTFPVVRRALVVTVISSGMAPEAISVMLGSTLR